MSFFTILLRSAEIPSHLLGLGSHTDELRFAVEHHKVMLEQNITENLEITARVALDTTKASL
jgi:hypothetical protein